MNWRLVRKTGGGRLGCKPVAWQLWLSEPPRCLIILWSLFKYSCFSALNKTGLIFLMCVCVCMNFRLQSSFDRTAQSSRWSSPLRSQSSHIFTERHGRVLRNPWACFHTEHQRTTGWEIKEFSMCICSAPFTLMQMCIRQHMRAWMHAASR